jgi:uncharacterized protein (TIGR02145 family)
MKKRILFLVFLLMVFGLRIDAQTLKNIHRHNQPVLRIPTHLIDKVETAEVNGTQVLQVRKLNGDVSEILLTQIDSITHSQWEGSNFEQLGNLRTASVMGVVRDDENNPEMNAIVRSPYGGEETRTDQNGVFFLNNILAYDKLGFITITKAGFHQGSRSFLPLDTGINRVNVQILPMALSGTFSAATGGTIFSGLLQLTFPSNAIALNGQPYNGTVKVYSQALDPTASSMFDQMPGELLGGQNDSLRLLRSFGMASVELRDTNMNELQLATGVSATLKFNIPSSLQSIAPPTIDWWSFDEEIGIWMHEGVAQKVGNRYVGEASHFSWWNWDVPFNFNNFQGSVNSVDGNPVSNAQINVVSPTTGSRIFYTNVEGAFTCRVPVNQSLTLDINLICNATNEWLLVHTENIVSEEDSLFGTYTASLDNYFPISGTLLNCQSQPITSGYVILDSQPHFTNQGQFTILACSQGQYTIRGYNTSNPDSTVFSMLETFDVGLQGIDLGQIQTCIAIFGTTSDFEGNVYPTVLIGFQWWMASNLGTSFFSNGEPIPYVSDNAAWAQLTSGAVCSYNNQALNDAVYGKLYNWYTTVDSRNLCPIGFHIPSDTEWTTLINFLGGQSLAKEKMTLSSDWSSFDTNDTNESGFTALPSGFRHYNSGIYNDIGNTGCWWSTLESSQFDAWNRFIGSTLTGVERHANNKRYGFSVRCLMD